MSAETQLTERLLTWLESVDDAWAEAGLSRVERRRLASELENSIVEGLQSGGREEDFLSDPPVVVAADIATANGFSVVPPEPEVPTRRSFRKATLIGAAIGAVVGWVVLFNGAYLVPYNTVASWVVVYAFVLVGPFAGPAIAVRRRFPQEPHLTRLQVLAVLGVLIGAILAAVPTWAVARSLDYPTTSVLVLPELVLALGICALTVDLAWRLGWPREAAQPELAIANGR